MCRSSLHGSPSSIRYKFTNVNLHIDDPQLSIAHQKGEAFLRGGFWENQKESEKTVKNPLQKWGILPLNIDNFEDLSTC